MQDSNSEALYHWHSVSVKSKRPALEGIIEEIERFAGSDFDIGEDKFLRQAIGSYIKFTLAPFGYATDKQKPLNKGEIIASATSYTFVDGTQKKRLIRKLEIVDYAP